MTNYIIIGGGIVGLSTAYAIRKAQPESSILIIEKEGQVASHQTGRNSGVIHSGIYYKPGSIKARLTTRGSKRMIDFCEAYGIKYDRCGKVIVATCKEEIPYLDTLVTRGAQNGLQLRKITEAELHEYEPYVNGVAAIYVPETGIVSYKKVSEVLIAELLRLGVDIEFNQRVTNIHADRSRCYIESSDKNFESEYAINCAGLFSDTLAEKAGVNISHRIIPFRGEYYELIEDRRYLVKNLIYPVPNPSFPFLGVHFTRMIDGSVHAGPNAVLSMKREGYSTFAFKASDAWKTLSYPGLWKLAGKHWSEGMKELCRSLSKAQFVRSLQRLIPEVQPDDLKPSTPGVRAQALKPDGSLVDDFLIKYHGRTVHVCNAPSPAATASLEIGDKIAQYVIQHKASQTVET